MSNAPATHFVSAVLWMALLAVLGTLGILFLASEDPLKGAYIAGLVGTLTPTTVALLALLKAQETHLSVNSRLDSMMEHAQDASRMQGREEGRAEKE